MSRPLHHASFARPSVSLPICSLPNALPKSVPKGNRHRRFLLVAATPFSHWNPASVLRLRSTGHRDAEYVKATTSGFSSSSGEDEISNEMLESLEIDTSSPGTSFLAKLAIALGIAATVTLISVCAKWSSSGSPYLPHFIDNLAQSGPTSSPVGFPITIFGYRIVIPEYTPGWVYFWLLMAAACGLFISEEALNVWVGISLARTLVLDGNWQAFTASFSKNAPYIVSTILWVYWGVCISDLIPFYLGRFFRKTKASEDICAKLGIGKEKAVRIAQIVQKYGNLIGFVERFSLGVRNPTAFLAGAWGISAECFFAGVCCGGLLTLPIQLALAACLLPRPAPAVCLHKAPFGSLLYLSPSGPYTTPPGSPTEVSTPSGF